MTRHLVAMLALVALTHRATAADPISPEQFNRLVELIKPKQGEEKFREIPWRASLWQARVEAAKTGKPILASLMAGPPLGCT